MRSQYLRLLDIDPKQRVPEDLTFTTYDTTYEWPSLRCNWKFRSSCNAYKMMQQGHKLLDPWQFAVFMDTQLPGALHA